MLYSNNNGKLVHIKQVDFKLEKELQTLVEKNIYELFGIEFLRTEFSLNNFRFDSVAFSKENNAFVIVEYKKGSNESLVDQGYAYLNTVIDRKADLVLLYNNIHKENKSISDFDWEATRVYFVSPKFTDYQKAATGYQKMPFSLFEINKYNNGDVFVKEINDNKLKGNPGALLPNDSKAKEISVYTEDDLLSGLSDSLVELYSELKNRILGLGNITIKPTKLYIAFKLNNTNICDIEPFKKELKVFINMPKGSLLDSAKYAKDISNVGHHGNGDYVVGINNQDDLDYLMSLIRQSYKVNDK